jgi:3-phenylpropionate/trans-cinnamate dioxygenase ferredoxin subunit
MSDQPRTRVREISLRTADPNGFATLLEQTLGFTKLRSEEDIDTAILTDGYIQIGITGHKASDDTTDAMLDHIGVEVAQLDGACDSLYAEGWDEAPNSTPATRFVDGPSGWQIELREPGWGYDKVIQAGTQLYGLVPIDDRADAAVVLQDIAEGAPRDEEGFVRVIALADLPEGGVRVDIGSTPVFVVSVDGTLYAVNDACPHLPRFGRISEGQRSGTIVECPIHRSRFDLADDGRVLDLPAKRDLSCFAAVVRDGDVWVRPEAVASARSAAT